MQSVPITTEVVSSNPVHCELYPIQHYAIKFISDQRQVGRLLRVLHQTNLPWRYTWHSVESGVEHHKYKYCSLARKNTNKFAPLIIFAVIDHANVYFLLVNGNWGSWGSWNWCTKTCGGGTRTRYRYCNNPTPANGGSTCPGLGYHTESCSTSIVCTGISIICCLT